MNKVHPVFYALLSGILFAVSWPEFGSLNVLLFTAFVPLLYIQHTYQDAERKGAMIMGLAFLAFFTWNIITTYWLLCVQGSPVTIFLSGFLPSVINASVMFLPFWLFHLTKKRFGDRIGFVSLPVYWLGMEYFHLQWDLTWTWLEIGNAFSAHVNWVQWYEFTGIHGGTLWVICGNLLIFCTWLEYQATGILKKTTVVRIVGHILVPIGVSYIILYNTGEKGQKAEVVVVQPNIDPYNEKFTVSYDQQLYHMLDQAKAVQTPATQLLVFPETAIQERSNAYVDETGKLQLTGLWENTIDKSQSVVIIRKYLENYPNLNVEIGMSSDSLYPLNYPPTATARKLGETGLIYDSFNAGMLVNSDSLEIYHKSKLVPAVERMPFVDVLRPLLGDAAIDFGGTSGGVGMQDYRSVFKCKNSPIKAAPVICYESLYGEFTGDYINNGANLITIITNDGWWSNTPGHKHHMAYARLRAIEHRRDVARSANTGISAFINQRGEVLQQTAYWVPAAIRGTVHLNSEKTFYTIWGDYLARTSFRLSVVMCAWLLLSGIYTKYRNRF